MFNIFSNTIVKVGHFLVYTIAFQTVLFSQTDTTATRARLQKIYEAYDNEKIKEGLKLADEGIVQSIATNDSSSVVALSQMKSKFFRLNNEIENAMNSLIYGMKYATKPADKIKLNHQIGEILLDIGAYNSAVPYLEEMVNTEKNPMSKFYHCNLLGQAYLKSNKKEKCIKVFEKQLEIAKTLKEEHFVINANNNLGFVLLKFKEFEAAKKHLNFVVNTLSKKEKLEERDQIILTNALIILSQFYYQLSDYKQGVVYFEKAEVVAQGKIDGVNVNKSYFYSLLNTGQLDKATQLLQRLRKQADDDASRLMLSSYFMEYYSRVKKYDLLANEIKKHDSLEINVRAEIEQSNQKNLDLVGDFYVSSAENHLNLEENKYQKLADQKESAFRLYIISILGGLLILIASIYLFYEKQRRTKLELQLIEKEKENLDISLELKQKDLSKASIDLSERAKILEEFLTQFKNAAKKDAEEVKAMVVEELKSLSQFNASRATLNQFLEHTDVINTAFHEKLKAKHPDLSQNEIDLCSYIILNISTKDIANLKGIEPNSVRINKTRLKKKMGLTDEDLSEYLNAL